MCLLPWAGAEVISKLVDPFIVNVCSRCMDGESTDAILKLKVGGTLQTLTLLHYRSHRRSRPAEGSSTFQEYHTRSRLKKSTTSQRVEMNINNLKRATCRRSSMKTSFIFSFQKPRATTTGVGAVAAIKASSAPAMAAVRGPPLRLAVPLADLVRLPCS